MTIYIPLEAQSDVKILDSDYRLSYTFDGLVRIAGMDEMVDLTPREALAVLEWLTNQHERLTQLAKVLAIAGKQRVMEVNVYV